MAKAVNYFLKKKNPSQLLNWFKTRWLGSRQIYCIENFAIPVIGIVTNHDITIFPNNFQLTTSLERKRPTKTTEPTLQCVVDIGIPRFDANNTVSAEPISIAKPLKF